ncbi:MAG: hypothetical protein Q9184_002082 [Pyrenodesmia sp. 2 TL-2023]
MAATHTIARRKPATYGKASSNQLCRQFTSSAFDPLAPSLHLPSPPSRTLSTKATVSSNLPLSDYDTPASQGILDLPQPNRSSARLPQSPSHHHQPNKRTMDKADAWNVSSSGEEYGFGHTTRLIKARKKRKHASPQRQSQRGLLSGEHGTSSPYARSDYPDQSLELLPPAPSSSKVLASDLGQASIDAASAQRPGSGQRSRPGLMRALEPRSSQVSHMQLSPKSPPSTPRRSTTTAASATPSKVDKTNLPSTTSRGTAPQQSKETKRANKSPPSTPRTQTAIRKSVEATTPHQRELWGMLLPQGIQYPSPTCAASLSSESPDRSRFANASMKVEMTDVLNRGSRLETATSRRRRLIDGLQPVPPKIPPKIQESLGVCRKRDLMSDSDKGNLSALNDGSSLCLDDCSGTCSGRRPGFSDLGNSLPPRTRQHRLLPGNGHKITYSSQRSHLLNVGMEDTYSFDMALSADGVLADVVPPVKRIQDKAPASGLAAFAEPTKADTDGPQNSSMRTIYELRESGENVRQTNEMEALFDDLDGPGLTPVGLKHAKLLELAKRVQEPACCRLLLDQGFDSRLLRMSASGTSDAVTDILLASIVLHFVAAPFGAQAISRMNEPFIADLFGTRLKDDNDLIDVVQARRSNVSKRHLSELKEYLGAFSHSHVWRRGNPIKLSSRAIGLQGLEHFVRKRREAGCKTNILRPETIKQLVGVLPLRCEASWTPSSDDLLETRLTVSILESCTISGASHDESQWAGATLAPLLAILPRLTSMSVGDGQETQRLALRLYLNLTNNNPRLCGEFAKTDVIRSILSIIESNSQVLSKPNLEQQSSDPAALDTLILALGTLINLVEWSAAVRYKMASKTRKDECFLDTLVELFAARLKIVAEVYSEEETSSNVAFGYLAVLLAYLSVDEEARAIVANQLKGKNLQQLVGVVEEFLQYHRQIDDELDVKEGEVDLKTSFVGRLEKLLARLTDVA